MSCTAYSFKGFAVRKDVVGFGGGGGGTVVGLGGGGGGAFAFFLGGGTGTAPNGELVAPAASTSSVAEPDCPELRRDNLQEKSNHTSLADDTWHGRTRFPARHFFRSFRYSAQRQVASLA